MQELQMRMYTYTSYDVLYMYVFTLLELVDEVHMAHSVLDKNYSPAIFLSLSLKVHDGTTAIKNTLAIAIAVATAIAG